MQWEFEELMDGCRKLSYINFGKRVNFYYTSDYFPAISVTGSSCALNCKHCNRILIERLTPAETPEKLVEECMRLHEEGARGVLITGGSTREGKVPLDNFLDAIKRIKEETGLLLIAHTGIVNNREAQELRKAGIEAVCVDVVGSEETTKEIYGIELYPEDYRKTLKAFQKAEMKNISPHICVGLHYGELRHEFDALDIISTIKPSNVVVIGLTNLKGTLMEDTRINPADVLKVLIYARIKFPESYLSLGCARGKGDTRAEIDEFGLKVGVNNIAVPTPSAYREAERLGLEVREYKSCCALLPEQLE